MDKILFEMIKRALKDIKDGKITEEKAVEILKKEGLDWFEIKKAYENLQKLSKIIKGK